MKLRCLSIFSIGSMALLACKSSSDARIERAENAPPREWDFTRPAPATATAEERSLAVPLQPTLVRQGSLPLVYMVESSVTVTVTDSTSGAQIAQAPAEPSTIVRIEPRRGVYFNTRQIVPGPLDPQHSYAIYVQTNGPSSIRSETISPAESGRP